MRLTSFWVVRDPSPVSEFRDICFKTDPHEFVYYSMGAMAAWGKDILKRENTAIYTEEAEARADANDRLARRHA